MVWSDSCNKMYQVRNCTVNFQGLCIDRKTLEIGKVSTKNHINILGVQEMWELHNSKIKVPHYKRFGKPSEGVKGSRGEGEYVFW